MFSGSVDAGFVLVLPFQHGDLEPNCVGVSTRVGAYVRDKNTSARLCTKNAGTVHSNDGHTSYFAKAPCFLAPQCKSFTSLPLASVASLCLKVSVVEWQRKNEASIHRTAMLFLIEGGRNCERKCPIPRIKWYLVSLLDSRSCLDSVLQHDKCSAVDCEPGMMRQPSHM